MEYKLTYLKTPFKQIQVFTNKNFSGLIGDIDYENNKYIFNRITLKTGIKVRISKEQKLEIKKEVKRLNETSEVQKR